MYIHEYGNTEDPTVILLAPMLISGEDLYKLVSPHLKGRYHVVAPDQGGHGKAEKYSGAQEEYRELKTFLLDRDFRKIDLLYGASMGAATAYRLFLDPDFDVVRAWFDGVMLSKSAGFAEWLMRNMLKCRKRKLDRKHAEVAKSLARMYGYDFAKLMTGNFMRVTPEDIDAICHACCHYELRMLTNDEQKKLHLDFGEKDPDWKYARKTVLIYMPNVELAIRKGYSHCGYMAAHPQEYVKQLEAFMRRK